MAPTRPYSTWRNAGPLVVISGQLGVVPAEVTTFVDGGATEQLRQALANARTVLGEAGASLSDVIKATLFVVDISELAALNEVWLDTFSDPLPTRTAVEVRALPYGALVEVELWAHVAPAGHGGV